MSLTPSTMLELGTVAPDFALLSPDGQRWVLAGQRIEKGLLVMFICNHCPYVIHIRPKLIETARRFINDGISVVAINANDYQAYPADSPDRMTEDAKLFDYPFPYLVDEDQQVARAYRAACTPDFFLFDADLKLVYRGQFDGARPGNSVPVTGIDLISAVTDLLTGRSISSDQRPSMGCNIKWKDGNQPAYFR